jgi:hypothetical protein
MFAISQVLAQGPCFGVARSNHHKANLAVLEAFARQAILGHFLDPVPVLAEIARSLLLCLEFRLQATSVALVTVCNLKKKVCRPSSRFCLVGKALRIDCSFANV